MGVHFFYLLIILKLTVFLQVKIFVDALQAVLSATEGK